METNLDSLGALLSDRYRTLWITLHPLFSLFRWRRRLWTTRLDTRTKVIAGRLCVPIQPIHKLGSAMDRILHLNLIQTLHFEKRWADAPVAQNIYGLFGLTAKFFQLDDSAEYNVSLAHLYAATTINLMQNAKHLTLPSSIR